MVLVNLWWKVRQQAKLTREVILPGSIIVGLILIIRLTGFLQLYEWMSLDYFSRNCPSSNVAPRITIVSIDENDLRMFGGFPLPDDKLAKALQIVNEYKPRVIGIDIFRDLPVGNNQNLLIQAFQKIPNIVGIEVALNEKETLNVKPPPALPPERIGFADVLIDEDGKFRRSLLASRDWNGELKYSFVTQLARVYLSSRGLNFEHGNRVKNPIKFDSVEIPALKANTGGYVNVDANGNQMLVNFCSSQKPLTYIHLRDIIQRKFSPELIKNRAVIFGVTAASVKDTLITSALKHTLFSQISGQSESMPNQIIYGVEAHAHALRQILSTVLDKPKLLKTWSNFWEYVWIVIWGIIGVILSVILQSPWKSLVSIAIICIKHTILFYLLLIWGWWIPFIPTCLVFSLAGLTTSFFDRGLRAELKQRRDTIERTYEEVHNGPLQSLAVILRSSQEDLPIEILREELQNLNKELRNIFEYLQQEAMNQTNSLYLQDSLFIDLQNPISELLYQVYDQTLNQQLPGFSSLQTFISPIFDCYDDKHLNIEEKRGLCLFLQEALYNVGKHAKNATRLDVYCSYRGNLYSLRITDNGETSFNQQQFLRQGQGTRQAKAIANRLRGKFRRRQNTPQGTICELIWPRKRWLW
ncbi:putative transmembrane sensor domain protein [Rivularia sp. PCC 7116]|uniref:CHASE2 domain-containing protein n=1 Tax=Rivularia sp. PCC 7116 TaxID=373994 RepID=UPI00029F2A35|nr:CHASE2 domain-containing protein [Rivularia sp. PCC 7116]AFY57184.1 putative transmembrane sensor domain protein [Rivularia sp. PCC 7116]